MALVMRYAVLFCRAGSNEPETVEWYAETPQEAIADVEKILDCKFSQAKARAIEAAVDVRKFGFNKEEAAYLCSLKRIDDQMASGLLPRPPQGMAPRFTRQQLFEMIAPKSNGGGQ
jgi:hypothetical protein